MNRKTSEMHVWSYRIGLCLQKSGEQTNNSHFLKNILLFVLNNLEASNIYIYIYIFTRSLYKILNTLFHPPKVFDHFVCL